MRIVLFVALVLPALPALAQDVIHLKTGESSECEIEGVTDNLVVFSLRTAATGNVGSAKRTLPMELVDFIEFDFEQGEEAVFQDLENISADLLETWWKFHFAHLHRPRSRTAAYGIAFGNALLREAPETGAERALSVFDRVIEKAWAEVDQTAAKQGRLKALVAKGDLDTAVSEASVLANSTEDPDLLLEVKYLLADVEFRRLKALEEEHPKWDEDDEVRPERNALYHRIIDQYLWPHLFHATREEAAARGLLAAGTVYEFAGETERALAAYEDLTQLYPATSLEPAAVERIASLTTAE